MRSNRMANPSVAATSAHDHGTAGNGANGKYAPFPNSRKVYVNGTTPGVHVPMREVMLTPTGLMGGGEETNPPLRLYDTSGPYSDPAFEPDLNKGLPPLRLAWILGRGDVEELTSASSEYRRQREADPRLSAVRFMNLRKPLRAK